MKHFSKLLIFIFTLFNLQLLAQLESLPQTRDQLSPVETPLSSYIPITNYSRNTVVLFEDFQSVSVPDLPDGWNGGDPVEQQQDNNNGIGLGTYVNAWQTGDAYSANSGGYLPVPHINDNLFVFVNDDGDPCNCDMEDVGLTTPELNFEGLENMMISFDVYSQDNFGGDNINLQISTDGSDFTTIYTAESSPEWQPAVVDLSDWDGEPTVWLRFAWSDNGLWSTGGAIDNVLVTEKFDYNGAILRAHTAEYTASFNDTATVSGEYTAIPLEQAASMTLGATVINKGALPLEDVLLSVTIFKEGEEQASYNSQIVGMLMPMQQVDLYAYTNFMPDEEGNYTVEYELLSAEDEDIMDNISEREIYISNHTYALDDDSADSFRDNNEASYTIGNRFEIPHPGSTCYSIGVGIGTGTTVGTEIFVRLYSSDYIFLAGSGAYTVQSADRNQLGENKFTDIPLSAPYELEAGKDYFAVVTYFSDDFSQFVVANSGSSQEQFSVIQNEIGDWYFVTTTPMVRMNLNNTVGVTEANNISKLQIVPNPVLDQFNIVWPASLQGKAIFRLTDELGRLISKKEIWMHGEAAINNPFNISHLKPGVYLLTVYLQGQKHTARFIKQ